jgi:hypothetical protein
MLETIIKLLERFVVAHELIAANSAKQTIVEAVGNVVHAEEKSAAAKDEPTTVKAKPEEDDLADDEPEEKPKTRKPRTTKPKAEPEPDLDKLREEIEVMAKHIGSGDSDDCADELDDLLDEYDARSVKKLKDLQVQEFHKELKAIVAKYYDIEE